MVLVGLSAANIMFFVVKKKRNAGFLPGVALFQAMREDV
jgi:hypothetical protein